MARPRAQGPRPRHLLIIALAAATLVGVVYVAPGQNALDRLEYRTVDWRFAQRPAPAPDPRIVIAGVGDASLQRLGRWPWPRSRWADLIRRLRAGGAQVIIFDILFPDRDPSGGDAEFAQAVREAGNVYLATAAGDAPAGPDAAAGKQTPTPSFDLRAGSGPGHLGSWKAMLEPIPELAQAAAGVGCANVIPAGDGVYRYAYPVAEVGETPYPSLALRTVLGRESSGEVAAIVPGAGVYRRGELLAPLDPNGRLVINYRGPAKTYHLVEVADLLAGPAIPETVRGKIVLVAATAQGLHDLRPSPFGAVFDGVETQANLLDSMLHRQFLYETPPQLGLVLIAGAALLTGLAFVLLPTFGAVLLTVALLAGYDYACLAAFGQRGIIMPLLAPSLSLALTLVGVLVYALVTQERVTGAAYRTLGKYVPTEVVERLARQEGGEGQGVRLPVTVLFSDLRDFTGSSAHLPPEDVVALLNRYFTLMYETLTEYGGTLDKYIGDGLMAYFLSPEGDDQHAVLAVHCAVEMQRRIKTNRSEWAYAGMPDLKAGIGIATGQEILGDIGSPERMQYTVIGSQVNLASRLTELTKTTKADIMIDAQTYELAKDYIRAQCLGLFDVQGFDEPQLVYEALDELGKADQSAPPV
ncbi:MAG TPA: adenylate/guanylate cyclase domain-containing protein [Armatimonadota bacterium]|jgi:adenylate cyclase